MTRIIRTVVTVHEYEVSDGTEVSDSLLDGMDRRKEYKMISEHGTIAYPDRIVTLAEYRERKNSAFADVLGGLTPGNQYNGEFADSVHTLGRWIVANMTSMTESHTNMIRRTIEKVFDDDVTLDYITDIINGRSGVEPGMTVTAWESTYPNIG